MPTDYLKSFQVLDTACAAIQTVIVKEVGLHLGDVVDASEVSKYVRTLKLWTIVQPFQVLAVITGRVSIAILLLRIVGFKAWQRYLVYACIGSTVISGLLFVIATSTQCDVVLQYTQQCLSEDIWYYIAIAVSGLQTSTTSFELPC